MVLKPGWLGRQFAAIVEDIVQWPEWMRSEADFGHEVKTSEYALRIAPNPKVREQIVSGVITASIRVGFRRGYEPGALLQLCCHIEPWCVMADIVARHYCTLGEVTEEEHQAAGYSSAEEHLVFLRTLPGYENVNWDSEVTVIRWNNVRGKLVERQTRSLVGDINEQLINRHSV